MCAVCELCVLRSPLLPLRRLVQSAIGFVKPLIFPAAHSPEAPKPHQFAPLRSEVSESIVLSTFPRSPQLRPDSSSAHLPLFRRRLHISRPGPDRPNKPEWGKAAKAEPAKTGRLHGLCPLGNTGRPIQTSPVRRAGSSG